MELVTSIRHRSFAKMKGTKKQREMSGRSGQGDKKMKMCYSHELISASIMYGRTCTNNILKIKKVLYQYRFIFYEELFFV